jgi:hypothetical protein
VLTGTGDFELNQEGLGEKMSVDLYLLKTSAVKVLAPGGIWETVFLLQLAVEHALSRDAQAMVDSAVKHAHREWEGHGQLPKLVVQVDSDGLPRPGSPIFRWPFFKRPYCFDHELSAPFGYLGQREAYGYLFRTVREQACLDAAETARRIDEGTAEVYKDFWHGEVFKSGEEFLRSRGQSMQSEDGGGTLRQNGYDVSSPRVSKILGLISFIKEKGQNASPADLDFLGLLREKAVQLGCSC